MKIKGKKLMVFVGSSTTDMAAIACATNSTLELTSKTTEERTKDDAIGPNVDVDYVDWSISTENLVGTSNAGLTADDLLTKMLACSTVYVMFGPVGDETAAEPSQGWHNTSQADAMGSYYGKAIIESLSIGAPVEGKATLNAKFKGAEALHQVRAMGSTPSQASEE